MKYYNIKAKLNTLKVFTLQDIYLVDPDFRQATLYDWESQGRVLKLRNNRYVFNDFIPTGFDYYLIANKMYSPSYISLEMALNHYGVIPEAVQTLTCVTTKKTNQFSNALGNYTYRSLDTSLYFGYVVIEHQNHGVLIASLEKAILDYLYLSTNINNETDIALLRWNKEVLKSTLDTKVFKNYLKIFSNKNLNNRVKVVINYIKS